MLSIALRLGGSAFHRAGEATAKALSPVVLADLNSDLAKVLLPTDLTLYLDGLRDKRLAIYEGAIPCTALKLNKVTLKIILNFTGSQLQWRSTMSGVVRE